MVAACILSYQLDHIITNQVAAITSGVAIIVVNGIWGVMAFRAYKSGQREAAVNLTAMHVSSWRGGGLA